MKTFLTTNGHQVIVDSGAYEDVTRYKWWAYVKKDGKVGHITRKAYYGGGRKNAVRKSLLLHREITNAPKGMVVDHINRNPLDNRRENLRICTNTENCRNSSMNKRNTSGYKGVYKHKNKWCAQITVNRKRLYLGLYKTKEDAYRKYVEESRKHFGNFSSV